jgi:hypothetical protein
MIQPPRHDVEPDWQGESAVIFGGGPSIERVQLKLLSGVRVVAINNAWRFVPYADVLFAGDFNWWETLGIEAMAGFKGEQIICSSPRGWQIAARDPRSVFLDRGQPSGLCLQPNKVSGRKTCVAQALSFLAHKKVSRIGLLGIDLISGEGGRRYGYSEQKDTHDAENRYNEMKRNLSSFVKPFEKRGVAVFDCSSNNGRLPWPFLPLSQFVMVRKCANADQS